VSDAYYVALDGDDANPGTEAQPFRTIGKGIGVLDPGDALYVASGTYTESLMGITLAGTNWNYPITIAAYPGGTVVVRPNSGTQVLTLADSHYVIIDGFILDGDDARTNVVKMWDSHHVRIQNSEIKGATSQGILVVNYLTVESDYNEFVNLDIHDNGTTDSHHGLYIETSYNLIDRCTIHHNAGFGVHVYMQSCDDCANDNVVSNNMIHDNATAGGSGAGIILSSGSGNLAYNNLVWGNKYGVTVAYGVSGAKVYNNTVYANDGYGISIDASSTGAVVQNNIVYENAWAEIHDEGSGTVQDHNLAGTDPHFIDALAHDFHLQPTSPAIDAGVTLSEVPDDFDGVSRPQGAGYDIGAYEY
jgi:nitrous oxidase accessory protein NosD